MDQHQVHQIVSQLGDEAITRELGVSIHSVRAAKRERVFPASWYAAVKRLCDEAGIDCPEDAFNFRSPTSDAPSERKAS